MEMLSQQFQVGKAMGDVMQRCIDSCQTCHGICLETTQYCLKMGGTYVEAGLIRLMMDCVQICQTSADYMIRGSDFHGTTCDICAEVCEHCSEECKSFSGDAQMQRCAEVCRMCAESCRAMVAQWNSSNL